MGRPKPTTAWDKVPHIFSAALKPIQTPTEVGDMIGQEGSITYKVNGHNLAQSRKTVAALNSENHAFYFGKSPAIPLKDTVLERLGFSHADRGTYNAQAFRTAFEYAKAMLEPGQTAKIVVASRLSALFNGPHSLEGHLSLDQEKDLLRQEAFKAGLSQDQVDIQGIEELPENQQLFSVLQAEADKAQTTQQSPDYLQAMIGGDMTLNPPAHSALHVAAILSIAALRDKKLMANLAATQPKSLKANADLSESNRTAYTISELAIRITDLLNGRIVQGGVDRQRRYDHFIWEFVSGKKGKYKKNPDLQSLFEDLEGKEIHTLHIKQNNHNQKKLQRNIARTRIGIWAVLAAALALSIAALGRNAGEEAGREAGITEGRAAGLQEGKEQYLGNLQSAADQYIAAEMKDQLFRFEGTMASSDQNVPTFKGFVDSTLAELKLRYDIQDQKFLAQIKPFLTEFLLQYKSHLPTQTYPWGWEKYNFIFLADKFYSAHPISFTANGYGKKTPYQHFEKHIGDDQYDAGPVDLQVTVDQLNDFKYLGELSNPAFYLPVKLYFVPRPDGGQNLAILDEINAQAKASGLMRLSNADIPKLRQAFLQDKECASVNAFRYRNEDIVLKALGSAWDSDTKTEFTTSAGDIYFQPLESIMDDQGRLLYQLGVYSHFNQTRIVTEKFLVARRPGETHYTTQTGKEAAKELENRLYPWKENPSP